MKQKVEWTVFICNCAAQFPTSLSLPPKHKWWPSAGLGAAHVLAYVSCAHRPGGGPSTLVSPHGRYILRSVLRGNVSCLSPPFVRLLMYHLGVQFNFVTAINADYMHQRHRQRKVRPGRLLISSQGKTDHGHCSVDRSWSTSGGDNESDDNVMSDEVKPTKQTRPKWMFIKQLLE